MKAIVSAAALAFFTVAAFGEGQAVVTGDVKVQQIGEERLLEELPEGLVFIEAESGELFFADGDHPHGRAVCVCKGFPNWHSFTNDVRLNGHALRLNASYSMRAEAGTLAVRFGTNSVLRILGSAEGELATLEVLGMEDGVLTLMADTPDPDAVLEVCTNLLDEAGWVAATNAAVTERTDASTTWAVTLGDDGAEFYRVMATVTREGGIYAERTLHAEAGVEMGGEKWEAWPDVGTIATNAANAAALPIAARIGALETNAATHATRDWTAAYVATNHQSLAGYATAGSVASVSNKVWGRTAETWTFVLTNGTSVSKSVVVEGVP